MRIILWMLFFTGFIWAFLGLKNTSKQERINKELKKQIYIDSLKHHIDSLQYTIDSLQNEVWDNNILDALIYVESCNNDSAYRASEDAVGCLQIRKTMVNDVNRILKRQKSTLRFTYSDRWSRNKSIQMFNIYCKHYNLITPEEIARCWNGGPKGIYKSATIAYWNKVKNYLDS